MGRAGDRYRCFEYTDRNIGKIEAPAQRQIERIATTAVGVGIARHYYWSVRLGFIGVPSVNFLTDPTGALELLKLRDKGSGKREAALHWVREHWRRRRSDPEAFTRVRAHMRGQTPRPSPPSGASATRRPGSRWPSSGSIPCTAIAAPA